MSESTPAPLLCVSKLRPASGVDTLLTAFGLLAADRPGLGLVVVGGGPLGSPLRRQAEHMGLADRVFFAGPRPYPAVRAIVRRCAALVLPGHDAADDAHGDVSLVVRDALTCARPVVATHTAAAPELLRPGQTALLVPPGDPPALALALAELLDDPRRAAALGCAGRELVDTVGQGRAGACRIRRLRRSVLG
ncbi:MAG TPA: glycosyltransferase [Geodermatophilus sp.]|nr:glycosyltransferase [Geodermatophilus sp.]